MNKNIIKKCLKESIDEMFIRNRVRQIVKEEAEKEQKKDNERGKRSYVTSTLKNNDSDKYDHANLAYELWPNMDPDSARSYFSKCVRGERSFSNKDITKLFELLRSK